MTTSEVNINRGPELQIANGVKAFEEGKKLEAQEPKTKPGLEVRKNAGGKIGRDSEISILAPKESGNEGG